MIRLTVPSIEEDDLKAVREVLATGFLVQGQRVAAFEQTVAAYVGTRHAVAVANCTAALHLSLLALGVGPGDRVAVTAYSWPATANVIALCGAEPLFVDVDPTTFNLAPGARPVFVDIEPDTYCLDPARLEAAITPKTRVIMPVDLYGHAAAIKELREIADRRGVKLIEDACQAHGAMIDSARAGGLGVSATFSFYPTKNITTGEGGMVTTDDDALARRVRILRNHGLDPDNRVPDFVEPGYNLRLTEFQAALGSSQMAKLERIIAARQLAAARYDALLARTELTAPAALPGSRHVYQSYVALLPPEAAARRGEIIADLRAREVETTIGTYHIPLTTYYRSRFGFQPGDFPAADDVDRRSISLPLFESITLEQQRTVVESLLRVCATASV